MNDIKTLFKQNSFQINPYVLKNIKKLNIDLNEFLLLLYFINIAPSLDLANIKDTIGLTEEEILNAYSNLITKGLIEIIVSKENGKVTETISLELLYDKLTLNAPITKENKNEDIYSKFENEFGRSISPMEYETINKWIECGISEETIIAALKEAVMNNVCNLRYIDKIIYEWTKSNKSTTQKREEYVPLYDCNWLERMEENGENRDYNRYIK